MIALYEKTKYRYGHRKIKYLLDKEYGYKLNRNTVQKLMQKHRLQCRVKKKHKFKADQEPEMIAPNVLAHSFTAAASNEKWVTDIKYGSTMMYLATILDLFNNEIVAYKMYDHQQTPLVMDVLKAALEARNNPKGVLVHSDQGSVYTSYTYQNFLEEMECRASMSRRGNCWDNAVIESFHSHIKTEAFARVKHHSLANEVARLRIAAYMKKYNGERIQEKLGYLTPLEFGKQTA
ncbi:MAG: IS3 family transposase [Solibacillus sp.]